MGEPQQHHIKWNSDCSMGAESGNFKLQFIHNMGDELWQELSSHQYTYHKGRRIAERKVCWQHSEQYHEDWSKT